jgi:glucose-6-phosphate isomerase, archaeal
MKFDPGLNIQVQTSPLGFSFGAEVFGPVPEYRRLDQIRASLREPGCDGPDPVYAIVMDVGKKNDLAELRDRMLLFGVVAYAAGRLGREPVRSQGHIHRVSWHSGWRPPELYEIWQGEAIIYMQEKVEEVPGRCYAIEAGPGEIVVVPPGWAHATISASVDIPLTFGAWCDREYGFEYEAVRSRQGLAWYPLFDESGRIIWQANPKYQSNLLIERKTRTYEDLNLSASVPIYRHFEQNPAALQWISQPAYLKERWRYFEP